MKALRETLGREQDQDRIKEVNGNESRIRFFKKPVTMRLSEEVVLYFKNMALEAGVPYQSLINLYLRDCVAQHRKVKIAWPPEP